MTALRVLVVEDNVLSRLGIESLIKTQPDMVVVGTAADGAQAVTRHRELLPDVTVCDLRMPRFDGFQAITAIRAAAPESRILVLTNFEGEENIHRAISAGALGYVTKDTEGTEILEAIRIVAKGGKYLPATIARQLAERSNHATLTGREVQVLVLVAQGMSNRQIGDSLGLTKKTADAYVSRILEKMNAQSRTEAVAIARQRGVIAP